MKFLLSIVFCCFALLGQSQILEPVKWNMSAEAVSANEYDLVFTAQIDPGWNIYSQFTEEGGPVPTSFNFDEAAHFERVGKVKEIGEKKEGPDPLFAGANVIKFTKGPVVFRQRVKVSDASQAISGWLEFMCCDDERCLPPTEVDFSFDLSAIQSPDKSSGAVEEAPLPVEKVGEVPAETLQDIAEKVAAAEEQIEGETAVGEFAEAQEEQAANQGNLLDPVQWSVRVEALGDQQYRLTFTADLDEGWQLYSQDNDPDNGPIPTEFTFEGEGYTLVGKTQERGELKSGYDALFDVEVNKFLKGPVTFTQDVSVQSATGLRGNIYYISCDDEQCTPPQEVFFNIGFAPLAAAFSGAPDLAEAPPVNAAEDDAIFAAIPASISEQDPGACGLAVTTIKGASMWRLFVLGFLGGLVALLTPCVFPMIPLTVSYFTKSTDNKSKGIGNAVLYGGFIFLVYLLLSVPFHVMDSVAPDILNQISTNVFLNVFFFAIFVFFALSFFGYYELTLPSSWTNKASSAEGIGGVVGIFFMALTLALVSFSCTGPILGTLLAGALSADGGAMQLTAGMGGFGLALALPFALFAAFPQMMSSLPKSGGWLNNVKVVLGFVELGLAIKFLSNADMVDHWGILRIEPFLLSWMVIGIGLALYLFGYIHFPHDNRQRRPGPLALGLGVVTLAFVAYLGSGFLTNERSGSYQPLTLLSGLAPPVCYSFFNPCDCPQGLECFKDLEEGLAYAKEVNKPILIDFTGYACVNCRKMEEHVWPTKPVFPHLNDDYVLISLYVDDKEALPEAEQQTVTQSHNGQPRRLRKVGDKWSHFQAEYFKANTQPYYVLLSPDGQNLLTQPRGYTPDEEEYANFLRCGLENYQRLTEKGVTEEQQLGME